MRIIINTGKGGVGKSTISALTSINISKRLKTLLISSDLAHSLSDLFAIKLTANPTRICENLYALEINPIIESAKAWQNLNSYLRELVKNNSLNDIQVEELLLFPGLEDVFSLLKILEIYKEGKYEVLVVDCGPSAETISLLSTGEKLNNLADTLVPLVKRFNSLLGGFIEKKTEVKKPKDIVFDEFVGLSKKLYELEKILMNPEITSVRFVTKASKVISNETFRASTLMNMYGFLTDCVYINMLYPEEIKNSSYDNLYLEERENVDRIEEFYPDKRVFKIYMKANEVIGLKELESLNEEIFSKIYLEEFFTACRTFDIKSEGASKIIEIDFKFASDKEVDVRRIGDDLELSYLNFKRRFKLPDTLSSRKISSYSIEDEKLKIVMDYD